MGLTYHLDETWNPEYAGGMDVISDLDPLFSPGALILSEVAHPVAPWAPGLVAHGSFAPNVFADNATAIVGAHAGSGNNVGVVHQGLGAASGQQRRTARGGLHVGLLESNDVAFDGLSITIPNTALWAHIRDSGHEFYYSLWARRTRIADPSVDTVIGIVATGSKFLGGFVQDDTRSDDGGARSRPATNDLNPTFRNVGASGFPMQGTADPVDSGNRSLFTVGNRAILNRFPERRGKGGAAVFYRCFVEDLTISGRSYAHVDALDHDLFQRHMNTPGGRYYGDDNG